uniref:Uncharacterized protein n=1 Tax=Hucho hucho TaxID=62062 RepID=A0A4W5N5P6_9TELE
MHLDFCSPFPQASNMSFASLSRGKKVAVSSLGVLTAGGASIALMLHQSVKASDRELHPPSYPWTYSGMLSFLDHARLLHLLYVIITCERMIKTFSHTETEVKVLAEEVRATDLLIKHGGEDYMFSLLTGYCEPPTTLCMCACSILFPNDISPQHDQRKQMGLKLFMGSAILVPLVFYMKSHRPVVSRPVTSRVLERK